jgi:hypothetical protein
MQVLEAALMKELSVPTCAREPPRDGGMMMPEDPRRGGRIESFRQRREDHGNMRGWGFQPIQGRISSPTPGAAASLTTEDLDLLDAAMFAIPDQRMDVRIGFPEVWALPVRTGEALSGDARRRLPAGF